MRPHFKLSPGDKVQVVSLRAGGMTWTDTGRLLDIDRRTAACCYDAVMERNSYERKRGTGKMRKTSRREISTCFGTSETIVLVLAVMRKHIVVCPSSLKEVSDAESGKCQNFLHIGAVENRTSMKIIVPDV